MCIVCGGSVCAGSGACTQVSRSILHYVYMGVGGLSGVFVYRVRDSIKSGLGEVKKTIKKSTQGHPYTQLYKTIFKK